HAPRVDLWRRLLGPLEHRRAEDEEHGGYHDGELLSHLPATVPEYGAAPQGVPAPVDPDVLDGEPGELHGRRSPCAHPDRLRLDGPGERVPRDPRVRRRAQRPGHYGVPSARQVIRPKGPRSSTRPLGDRPGYSDQGMF